MLKNYIKIAWRNLVKNKGYSAINIGGLAVGMSVAMLIGLWVWDELSYNKYHRNYNSIAQVMQHSNSNGETKTQNANPYLMAAELRAKYGSSFKHVVQASWAEDHYLSVGTKQIKAKGMFLEADAPEMFTLDMLTGTKSGLKDPYSIILSKSVAEALFGKTDPINKTIKLGRSTDLKVTAVYNDLPGNTTLDDIRIMMPWQLWLIRNPWVKDLNPAWGSNQSQTFVQIADNTDMAKVSAKIKNVKLDNLSKEDGINKWVVFLHPMSKWNLYSEFKNGKNSGGNIQYVWLFGVIGIFVLSLACINFMNLSTARSYKRAKEVGVRKTVGSSRSQILKQFFAESYLVVLLAFILGLVLVVLFLPQFNDVSGKKIEIAWTNPIFWSFSIIFILITGLVSGSYPAFYLSSFNPLKVLKGTFRVGKFAAVPRKVLVTVQFTVSVMLIIGTIVVYQQIQHAKKRPIGYTRQGLVNINFEPEIKEHFESFRAELKNLGVIEEMAASFSTMTQVWNSSGGYDWEGKDPSLATNFPTNKISYEFGKTVNWKIKNGRDFSRKFKTDSNTFIINETAAKFFGFKNAVGKTLKWNGEAYTIVGVVNDIMQESPFNPVRPSLYHLGRYGDMSNLIIKLNPHKNLKEEISIIEQVYKKYCTSIPFTYKFVDEKFADKFVKEERIGKLALYFALLAIFISCLGLFGMASFIAEQRTKEIGIRKVLGAGIGNVWRLISSEFFVLVLISCAVATPIAWFYLKNWLIKYDYRISIGWEAFAIATGFALIITMLTVSFQAIKAAVANPVKSLRSE